MPIQRYNEKVKKVRYRYGIEMSELSDLLDQQKGVCAICGIDFGTDVYHIDHCHTTGRVRGLLCSNCNTGIGLLQEDKEIFKAAINYLEK